jgi:hypothetical protein
MGKLRGTGKLDNTQKRYNIQIMLMPKRKNSENRRRR